MNLRETKFYTAGKAKGKKYFVLKLGKIENTETLVNNIKVAIKNENDKI